jgi:hypothetical protein
MNISSFLVLVLLASSALLALMLRTHRISRWVSSGTRIWMTQSMSWTSNTCEEIIDGRYEATELVDANYNGKIDEEDTAQIELINRGRRRAYDCRRTW